MICADCHRESGDLNVIIKGVVYCLYHGEIRTGERKWGKKSVKESPMQKEQAQE